MADIILETRINPPRLLTNILHRKRLLDLLESNRDKGLILVCSAAGFGKTTLVTDFFTWSKRPFAWFSVSSDISSFFTFLTYLVKAIKNLNESFGLDSLRFIESVRENTGIKISKEIINDSLATLLNEFTNNFKDEIYIVIDDLHNLRIDSSGDWFKDTFDYIFDNLPQNLHFIITTREIPGFNLAKLSAKRRVIIIETKDLMFTDSEVKELLEEFYDIKSSEDFTEIQNHTHGWVTGIHLIMQSEKGFKKKLTMDKIHSDKLVAGISDSIFHYFAEDVFENLSHELKKFLTYTSLLDNFDYDICNHLLEINNSKKIINGLVSKHLFIESRSVEKDIYSYHELFKKFLEMRINEFLGEKEVRNILLRIANYYNDLNAKSLAITYFIKAKEFNKTVNLLLDVFDTEFEMGNLRKLWKWISAIPDEIINSSDMILLQKAQIAFYYALDSQKTLELINVLINRAKALKNSFIYVNAVLLKAEVLYLLGQINELMDTLNTLLSEDITLEYKTRILILIAKVYYQKGSEHYDSSIKYLKDALELCGLNAAHVILKDIYHLLGIIYTDFGGEFAKALYYLEKVLQLDKNVFQNFSTITNIIDLYTSMGNYSSAKEYYDRAVEIFNRFPTASFKRTLYKRHANFRHGTGDFEEAINEFKKAIMNDLNSNITQYLPFYYSYIGDAYYYLNQDENAKENLELVFENITGKDKIIKIVINYLNANIEKNTHVNKSIEERLLQYCEYHEKVNMIIAALEAKFRLADFYLKSGMNDTAFKYLSECLATSAQKQYLNFFENEVFISRHLYDFAIENNIEKQFVKTILENARNKINYEWLSDACKSRLAVQIETLTDLKLYSFGRTEIWLRGNPIPEDKWIRKKSKIILAYLLTKPGMVLNKNKIIDLFFQDTPLENVDSIFHNAISNIRSAIKIDALKHFKESMAGGSKGKNKPEYSPQFIIYEDKNLSLNKDYRFESDCLEFERYYNMANSASSKTKDKIEYSVKAIELYKGEFMPGYYEQWCEEMREACSNKYQKLCENLIGIYYNINDYKNAIKYSEKLLEIDKLHSEAYLKLIESHIKLNNINTAKDKFALMLKNYEEELGEKPEKQVLSRINEMLSI